MAIVSNQSVPLKIKTALLALIPALLVVFRAAGVDWGAIDEQERLVRESALLSIGIALVILGFAMYAHLKKTTVGEPVAVVGAVSMVVGAVFLVLLAFDVFSEALTLALEGLVIAVGAPFGISAARQEVYPVSEIRANPNLEPEQHT